MNSIVAREERARNFQELAAAIHKFYALEYVDRGSETVVIVFAHAPRPALRNYEFRYDCLYVTDRKLFYYLHNPGRQAHLLQRFIDQAGYKTAIFIGLSKGGVGSLLWSSLICRRDAQFRMFCLAFSPQTLLYPFNDNLTSLPSYVSNIRIAEGNERHRKNFETYGNLPEFVKGLLPPTMIVFANRNSMDHVEAHRLAGEPNVELKPLEMEFHGSITPFVVDRRGSRSLKRLAAKLYADAERDIDLKSMLPPSQEQFMSDFDDRRLKCPSLNTLIDDFCGFEPLVEPGRWDLVRRWLPAAWR
ncbi:hypothetical protein CN111_32065 [Sinorhizobium meliloti]|uniref:hypothetical protein n=1 Tax=Rhizobium meliloti TaxID=382 RepID=UPI000FDAD908|nr:hypothetical protein [Sinorhizobium meliloti]RVN32609.1 hypothetical protein CN111_32065 [Sinorhizobium meliloti]